MWVTVVEHKPQVRTSGYHIKDDLWILWPPGESEGDVDNGAAVGLFPCHPYAPRHQHATSGPKGPAEIDRPVPLVTMG